ncbi:MAG: iron-sulfur cluster repair di-iron protein [Prevotella sp.]|jgi:regulator of cell morphogenesis and NO signaling
MMQLNEKMTVGAIVAEDFNRARLFEKLGIDYCCHGSDTLQEACNKKGLNAEDVLSRLEQKETEGNAPDFSSWDLDLLVDYVLKKHHRSFHQHHEELLRLVEKVEHVHGDRHPELHEIRQAVADSFDELDSHFAKEEQILFPLFYELFAAHEEKRKPAPFHCGSIFYPIRQMMLEHDNTGATWQHIADLTENFTTPTDGCASYRLMNRELYEFFSNLKEHVALENNLIFPGFIKMEQSGMEFRNNQ